MSQNQVAPRGHLSFTSAFTKSWRPPQSHLRTYQPFTLTRVRTNGEKGSVPPPLWTTEWECFWRLYLVLSIKVRFFQKIALPKKLDFRYSEGNLYMCKIGFAYFSVMASFCDHFSIGAFEAMTQKCCVWVWSLSADCLQFWSIFCQKSLKIHEKEKILFPKK